MEAQQPSNPLVFDGHNDTILNLYLPERSGGRSFFKESPEGHIDLPRAQAGRFGGGFFAMFAPAPDGTDRTGDRARLAPGIDGDFARQFTLGIAASLIRLLREADGKVRLVRTAAEVRECFADGVLALLMHIEGADAIDPELDFLYLMHAAGLRSLGLVWSRPNAFAEGVPFRFPSTPDTGPGLTDAGRRLVQACNELSLVIDLSHLNEQGFWDVAGLTGAPLVATHSNAHALCPSARNLTDKQLDAIRESGGIVGTNFHVSFLRSDGEQNPDTPLSVIADHIDYMVDHMGLDHVGFGSDFDGATMPTELRDVSGLPRLLDELRARGYDEAALRKIAHENWLRVLEQTLGA